MKYDLYDLPELGLIGIIKTVDFLLEIPIRQFARYRDITGFRQLAVQLLDHGVSLASADGQHTLYFLNRNKLCSYRANPSFLFIAASSSRSIFVGTLP